jgi:hypothetical protein
MARTKINLSVIFLPGLLRPYMKNQKFLYKNELSKQKNSLLEMSDLSNDTKKTYLKILWDYPFKGAAGHNIK